MDTDAAQQTKFRAVAERLGLGGASGGGKFDAGRGAD